MLILSAKLIEQLRPSRGQCTFRLLTITTASKFLTILCPSQISWRNAIMANEAVLVSIRLSDRPKILQCLLTQNLFELRCRRNRVPVSKSPTVSGES